MHRDVKNYMKVNLTLEGGQIIAKPNVTVLPGARDQDLRKFREKNVLLKVGCLLLHAMKLLDNAAVIIDKDQKCASSPLVMEFDLNVTQFTIGALTLVEDQCKNILIVKGENDQLDKLMKLFRYQMIPLPFNDSICVSHQNPKLKEDIEAFKLHYEISGRTSVYQSQVQVSPKFERKIILEGFTKQSRYEKLSPLVELVIEGHSKNIEYDLRFVNNRLKQKELYQPKINNKLDDRVNDIRAEMKKAEVDQKRFSKLSLSKFFMLAYYKYLLQDSEKNRYAKEKEIALIFLMRAKLNVINNYEDTIKLVFKNPNTMRLLKNKEKVKLSKQTIRVFREVKTLTQKIIQPQRKLVEQSSRSVSPPRPQDNPTMFQRRKTADRKCAREFLLKYGLNPRNVLHQTR